MEGIRDERISRQAHKLAFSNRGGDRLAGWQCALPRRASQLAQMVSGPVALPQMPQAPILTTNHQYKGHET